MRFDERKGHGGRRGDCPYDTWIHYHPGFGCNPGREIPSGALYPTAQGGGILMAQRMVKCVKFGKELPGLDEPPWSGELGKRIYENVSQEAWKLWVEHLKMLINEYRLMPASKEAQEFIAQQMEQFFFGGIAQLPPDYVPPQKQS